MAAVRTNSTSTLLASLFGEGSIGGLTDEQLLARFVSCRDAVAERAFAAIVDRHGPMVLGVCRDVLGDRHDAEDAFQATFLVLARKAGSLREPAQLGPWLHGVARWTARKARTNRSRERLARQRAVAKLDTAVESDRCPIQREEGEMLHSEIDRLPERYRAPVVLCYLEGLTQDEAARRLGCPTGTVSVRLMRARERLRGRLARRGATAGSLAVLAAPPRVEAVTAPLAAGTVRSALDFAWSRASAAGAIGSHVTALAADVLRAMAIRRASIGVVAFVICGLTVAGSAALAFQTPEKRSKSTRPAAAAKQAAAPVNEVKSILTNGGFEQGDAEAGSPEGWMTGAEIPGVEYLWDRKIAHNGRASLHLKKTAQRYFPIAQWSQEVKRTGEAPRLKVSAFVKTRKMTKAILDVQFMGKGGDGSHAWAVYIGPKRDGGAPVTHDWKRYEGVVAIPAGTETIAIAAQIYGPGDVWLDDVVADYTNAKAIDPTGGQARAAAAEDPLADVADTPAVERTARGDARKRYFLIGRTPQSAPPADGYRLLLLLPGGDGSADFQPFARRIARNALPPGYLVAQLVAYSKTPLKPDQIVWPTRADARPGVEFTTDEFINDVITDVAKLTKLDRRFLFALGWSSGGPPVYAAGLRPGAPVTGVFVAMSIFDPERRLPRSGGRGRPFYILHSPQDFIPIKIAEAARDELRQAGATAELRTYEGGHGWHGDVYGEIRRGIEWLEANRYEPVAG